MLKETSFAVYVRRRGKKPPTPTSGTFWQAGQRRVQVDRERHEWKVCTHCLSQTTRLVVDTFSGLSPIQRLCWRSGMPEHYAAKLLARSMFGSH